MFFGLDLGEDVPLLRPWEGGWGFLHPGHVTCFSSSYASSHSLAPAAAFHIHPVGLGGWGGGGGKVLLDCWISSVIVVESEVSNHPGEECMALFWGGANRDFRGTRGQIIF